MSRTRATPDSSREITDSKRIDLKVLNKDPYDIDSAMSSPPPGPIPVGRLSPIDMLIDDISIERLADISVNSDELVEKSKAAKKILDDGIMNSDQGVEKLSNVVRGFWLSECFINSVRTAMKLEDIKGPVVHFANQDSAHQRWKLMKEDPLFKPSLMSLDSAAATNSDIMRLFLSILIGYWGDRDVLTKLDDAMGKSIFGKLMTIVALQREKFARKKRKHTLLYVEKREIKNFIYFIKDADDAKNLKHVQQWLVSTYGNDKKVNTDALLEEIQSELSRHLEISCFYDGKKAKIKIQIVDGLYAVVSMN